MPCRLVIVRTLAVVVTVGIALTAAPAPAASPAAVKYGTSIVQLTNHVRVEHDRPRLKRNKCLQRFAARQARRMADQRRMFHQDLGRIQRRCHVGWVGENVAYGPFSAKSMVRMWMASPDHRDNILFRQFRLTGAAARKAGGLWWASQVFGRRG